MCHPLRLRYAMLVTNITISRDQDFPPRHAFKDVLEPVAQDLDQSWPFRSYVAATGVLNLMARFIINDGVPKSDVGETPIVSGYHVPILTCVLRAQTL